MLVNFIIYFLNIIFYCSLTIRYLYKYDNYTYNNIILKYNIKNELYNQLKTLLIHCIKIDVIFNVYIPEILGILYINPNYNQYLYILSNLIIVPTKKSFLIILIKFVYYTILSYYVIGPYHIYSIFLNYIYNIIYTYYWILELNKIKKKIDM